MIPSNIWASPCVSPIYTKLKKAFSIVEGKIEFGHFFLGVYFYRSGWGGGGGARLQLHSSGEIYISTSLISAQSKFFCGHVLILRLSSPRPPSEFMIGWRCQNRFHNMCHKCTSQVYWHVFSYNRLWKLIWCWNNLQQISIHFATWYVFGGNKESFND